MTLLNRYGERCVITNVEHKGNRSDSAGCPMERSGMNCCDLLQGDHPMTDAPKDGRKILMLVRHKNWQFAEGKEKCRWEQWVTAYWTDHNSGGWVWSGIYGEPVLWQAL